jgi:hypothetical protein
MSPVRAVLKTLRPHQWVKNVFVAAPLVFAKHLADAEFALRAGLAVAAFCALAGAVYAFNDVLDVAADRAHPTKCKRPIAAGHLSERAALVVAALLALAGLGTASALAPMAGVWAAVYFAQNLAYSLQAQAGRLRRRRADRRRLHPAGRGRRRRDRRDPVDLAPGLHRPPGDVPRPGQARPRAGPGAGRRRRRRRDPRGAGRLPPDARCSGR